MTVDGLGFSLFLEQSHFILIAMHLAVLMSTVISLGHIIRFSVSKLNDGRQNYEQLFSDDCFWINVFTATLLVQFFNITIKVMALLCLILPVASKMNIFQKSKFHKMPLH